VTPDDAHQQVLVVDDHLIQLELLFDCLGAQLPGARCPDRGDRFFSEASEKSPRRPPDLPTLDLSLDDAAGLQALYAMRAVLYGVRHRGAFRLCEYQHGSFSDRARR
jgi:CheY-like chemotaxis protein